MRRALGTVVAAVVLVAVAACSRPAQDVTGSGRPADASSSVAPDPSGSSASGAATGSPQGATAEVTGGAQGEGPSSAQACTVLVGSQLRERTTVTASRSVTMLAGALPCRSVGVWVSSFALDGDAASDPTPHFAGVYDGSKALSATLPATGATCSATAVYFVPGADAATDAATAATVAAAVRADLAYWPAAQPATVPAGPILQGRSSGILAAAVAGDPTRCSPGANIATPVAAVGDCWIATAPAGGSGAAAAPGSDQGFRKTTCGAPHTHEVYWAETLDPAEYLEDAQGRESASVWARNRANDVCVTRRSGLRLAGDVRAGDIALEMLWPSSLAYPPGPAGWSKAQIVCLARWKDGKPSDRHLLHR